MNTMVFWLQFTLESDAALGRGDGVAGLVDADVKHDRLGLPYFSGKTLKGLLVAQCAEILFSLEQIKVKNLVDWEKTAKALFGEPGSRYRDLGKLRVEDANLPSDLRAAVENEFSPLESTGNLNAWGIKQAAYLEALTALRTQTAIDMRTGAPLRNTLRTTRVVLRTTPFVARLEARPALDQREKALLAACVCAFHRLGSKRNRGLGALTADLFDTPLFDPQTNQPTFAQPVTDYWLSIFEEGVQL